MNEQSVMCMGCTHFHIDYDRDKDDPQDLVPHIYCNLGTLCNQECFGLIYNEVVPKSKRPCFKQQYYEMTIMENE